MISHSSKGQLYQYFVDMFILLADYLIKTIDFKYRKIKTKFRVSNYRPKHISWSLQKCNKNSDFVHFILGWIPIYSYWTIGLENKMNWVFYLLKDKVQSPSIS